VDTNVGDAAYAALILQRLAPQTTRVLQSCPVGADEMWRRMTLPRLPIRWIDGCRARRVGELLAVLWLLSLADLVFTIWAELFTPFHELNPLAAHLLHHGQITALIACKVALTGLGAAIFWRLRRHARAELALWAVVLLYVLLAIRWSDYTNQVIALGLVTT